MLETSKASCLWLTGCAEVMGIGSMIKDHEDWCANAHVDDVPFGNGSIENRSITECRFQTCSRNCIANLGCQTVRSYPERSIH